jgi:hypothetical protein
MILKMIRHEYGPALTADGCIILYLHAGGLWRWIGSNHGEIDYDSNGDLKIIGVDLV